MTELSHGDFNQASLHPPLLSASATHVLAPHRDLEGALSEVRSECAHVARAISLGALAASIAHEVSQPLSGILTNASTCLRMLAADPPDISGARETARRTVRDGERASDIVTRLRILFTRREAVTELVDLNVATTDVVSLLLDELEQNGVVLRLDLAEALPCVLGDRVQLQQVILNLLLNAADAMHEVHGRPRAISIETRLHEGDQVRLSVRDAGVGLDADSEARLFEPFFTTKSNGMGIGLAVSRSIVQRHHGRIWADGNEGPGATFSFVIPSVV